MTSPRWMPAVLVSIALVLAGPASAAPVYMPLQMDRQWHYVTPQGVHDVETVSAIVFLQVGESTVLTHAVSHSPGGPQDGLTQFYRTTSDGTVYLQGFSRANENFSVLYSPALRLVQPPLAPGAAWADDVIAVNMLTGEVIATLLVDWEVATAGIVSVPAGDYLAYGIGYQALPAVNAARPAAVVQLGAAGWEVGQQRFTLTGERIAPEALAPVDWWAEDVGRVQYQADALYQLAGSGVTSAHRTTWGRVKQHAR